MPKFGEYFEKRLAFDNTESPFCPGPIFCSFSKIAQPRYDAQGVKRVARIKQQRRYWIMAIKLTFSTTWNWPLCNYLSEYLVCPFLWSGLILWHFHNGTNLCRITKIGSFVSKKSPLLYSTSVWTGALAVIKTPKAAWVFSLRFFFPWVLRNVS